MRLVVAVLIALTASAECIPVESDRILASDLAKAVPEFAAVPPDIEVGFAPLAGLTRTISVAELRRFGALHKVAVTMTDPVCIEFRVQPLTVADVEQAVNAGFGDAAARIQVVDFSRVDIPRGQIEFRRAELQLPLTPTQEPMLWRGRVRYAGQRTIPIWAKVRIVVSRPEVVAVSGIAAGHVITVSDVRVEEHRTAASRARTLSDEQLVVGRTAARDIPAGAAIQAEWTRTPQAIKPGQEVAVRVLNRGAVLKLMAKAEGPGRIGDSVMLINPASGKRFAAVVDSPGSAVVNVTGRPR